MVLLQESQKYQASWLIWALKAISFTSVLSNEAQYLILLNFIMLAFPWGNDFKWFDDWSQCILQDSTLKNRLSSRLEGFHSLLYGLSLYMPTEHSAVFITICSFNICFFFFFFSLLSAFPNRTAAEEENEIQDETLFSSLLSLSAIMTNPSNLKGGNCLYQDSECLGFMEPRRWTSMDIPKSFWIALIVDPPGKSTV